MRIPIGLVGLVWFVELAPACGSVAGNPKETSGDAAVMPLVDATNVDAVRPPLGADSSIQPDARRDTSSDTSTDAPPEASGDSGFVPYPSCEYFSGAPLFPCDVTQTCVSDCSLCPSKTLNCNETSACNNVPPLQGERKCVASCGDCGPWSVPNSCDNYCVSLADDPCNCGSCNASCPPAGPQPISAACTSSHCCPGLSNGAGTAWATPCNLCCVSGTCPPDPSLTAQLCTSALF
jgi:hypothetical protein